VTLHETLVAPAGTTISAATVTAAIEEAKATVWPPFGAGPVKLTIAVTFEELSTVAALSLTRLTCGATIVKDVSFLIPLYVAEMDAETFGKTGLVLMGKVPVVFPPPTLTVAGTVASGVDEARLTMTPVDGATAVNVTVPVGEAPPKTLVLETETELRLCEKPSTGIRATRRKATQRALKSRQMFMNIRQ